MCNIYRHLGIAAAAVAALDADVLVKAAQAITEQIGIFYLRERTQARLGYLSPTVFKRQFYEKDWLYEALGIHYWRHSSNKCIFIHAELITSFVQGIYK